MTCRYFLTKYRSRSSGRAFKKLILSHRCNRMERFFKYKLDHLFFWVITVFFHAYTRTTLIEKAGYGQFFLEIGLRNTILAVVIYFNLRRLWPIFLQQGKYVTYVVLLLTSLAVYIS